MEVKEYKLINDAKIYNGRNLNIQPLSIVTKGSLLLCQSQVTTQTTSLPFKSKKLAARTLLERNRTA